MLFGLAVISALVSSSGLVSADDQCTIGTLSGNTYERTRNFVPFGKDQGLGGTTFKWANDKLVGYIEFEFTDTQFIQFDIRFENYTRYPWKLAMALLSKGKVFAWHPIDVPAGKVGYGCATLLLNVYNDPDLSFGVEPIGA